MPPDLAVVIVTWNTRELVLDALRTLFADLAANGPDAGVWVVDSASTDGTPDAIRQHFPQAKLIASAANLGFAGGNNHALRSMGFGDIGLDQTRAAQLPRAVYLLNPDTRSLPGATRTLYDALFSLPRAGVVGPQLAYADGSFQHAAFRFPGLVQLFADLFPVPGRVYESVLNGRYPRASYARGRPFRVDHTLGAAMMLRREVLLQTGLLDEGYFMYCEEIDWSMRIRQTGWEIYAVPAATVIHLAGQSTRQARPANIVNLWRSRIRLFECHYSRPRRWLARRIIRLGMRRQIALVQRAYRAGDLAAGDRDSLIAAYRAVQAL